MLTILATTLTMESPYDTKQRCTETEVSSTGANTVLQVFVKENILWRSRKIVRKDGAFQRAAKAFLPKPFWF